MTEWLTDKALIAAPYLVLGSALAGVVYALAGV